MQVLLCGSGYAASYVGPLLHRPADLRLAGVLSRGSVRSRDLARRMGVAHYVGVDGLPDGAVDAAIVAVPGEAGAELTERLLRRRIPVLAEHPWEPSWLERAFDVAADAGVAFQVNGHFADLADGAGTLLSCAERLRWPPLYAHLTTNPRTLWSALDLLARVLGRPEPFELAVLRPAGPGGPPSPAARAATFAIVQGTVAGVPVTLLCQRQVSAHDDGSATLVNHHLELGYPDGLLVMADTFGPVVRVERILPATATWQRRPWTMLSRTPEGAVPPTSSALRDAANTVALVRFAAHVRGGAPPPAVSRDYLRGLAGLWRDALDAIGDLEVVSGFGGPLTPPDAGRPR